MLKSETLENCLSSYILGIFRNYIEIVGMERNYQVFRNIFKLFKSRGFRE